MSDTRDFVRGWLRKGDSDLAASRSIVAGAGPYDTACFHAQQAVEKYLKAVLAFANQPIPRTHNLEELEQRCRHVVPAFTLTDVDVSELTPYAVELRYDAEFWPNEATAEEALATAQHVRNVVLMLLPEEVHPS